MLLAHVGGRGVRSCVLMTPRPAGPVSTPHTRSLLEVLAAIPYLTHPVNRWVLSLEPGNQKAGRLAGETPSHLLGNGPAGAWAAWGQWPPARGASRELISAESSHVGGFELNMSHLYVLHLAIWFVSPHVSLPVFLRTLWYSFM